MDARSSIPRTSSLPTTKRLVRASFPAATADVPSEGRARMRSLGMVFALLAAAGAVLSTSQVLPGELAPLFAVNLLLATSLAVVAHVRAIPLRAALLWGLACEVLFALLVSVWGAWLGFERTGEIPEATWTCILIVTYPLIVPVPPRAMLVASSLAAATVPLGVAAIAWTSGDWPPLAETATVVVSPLFCVVIAFVGARLIHRMGRDVARARELGSYHLEERIGHGGMGQVWRARHHLLARSAAIKIVDATALGDDPAAIARVRARFEREAKVTASLRSPHTVQLYDYGTAADGALYYAMELLDGLDLEELVRRDGPQPAERVIHLLRQACRSLGEAHAAGLVHRDIKPANIVACRDGGEVDFVKVLDFGLVALRPELREGTANVSLEGTVIGTPMYLAPELVTDPEHVDGRADLYALGCVAFFLLTGEPVFGGENVMQIALAHVSRPPPAPSDIAPEVPEALERLVMRCLSKAPDERPASALEVERGLAEIELERPWTEDRARAWWDRVGV